MWWAGKVLIELLQVYPFLSMYFLSLYLSLIYQPLSLTFKVSCSWVSDNQHAIMDNLFNLATFVKQDKEIIHKSCQSACLLALFVPVIMVTPVHYGHFVITHNNIISNYVLVYFYSLRNRIPACVDVEKLVCREEERKMGKRVVKSVP